MMHQMLFVLFALQSYVVTATIPPGYALQEHLCSGQLELNTTVVLSDGEHRISSGPPCHVSTRGNISIVGSSMKNTTVHCEGEGRVFEFISAQTLSTERITFINCGIHLISIENILIMECTFQDSSNTTIFAESVNNRSIIKIEYCLFINNNGYYGGGVWLNLSTGNVSISNCTFQNNTATYGFAGDGGSGGGGGVSLRGSTGDVSISHCTFQNNTATSDLASTGGGVLLWQSTGDVSISHCTFQNNTATTGGGGGGGVSFNSSTGDVSISHSTFQNNIATIGGGVVRLLFIDLGGGDTGITNCTFQNNSAINAGGAVFSWVGVWSINLMSNMELNGKADTEPFGHLILQGVMIKDNHCSCNDYNELRGGAIYFNGMKGAIQGTNGFLNLHGNITFSNNTGVNGGAISLSNNVPLYFYEGCAVEFSRNAATGFGGALYNNGDKEKVIQTTWNLNKCTICLINNCLGIKCDFHTNMFSITFVDNHAQQGGHSVYATPIYNCNNCIMAPPNGHLFNLFGFCPNLTSYITTTPSHKDINDIQLLYFPKYVHLCGCSNPNLCNATNQYHGKVITYPGRTVRFNVTSVDEGNYLSPSVVYTQIDTNGITSPKITLGPTQKAQWIGTVCGTMEYQIYGPQLASLKLLLSNYPSNTPTVVEVTLLPCEPGFTLISNSSTGVMECNCSEFLTSFGVVCDASDGTVTRNKPNWIGVYNSTHPALASSCPMDYCNSAIDKVSLARPGDLCNGGRTGIICGSCHGNHSVVFGSSQCTICSNMWLITLVMFAVLGALLVAALFFLNFTVTQATLYGLIFYANIIQINSSIFFHQANPSLQIIVSFINLDLGIPMCFYNGMDDADKAGLQFVFPAYLLILTLTVIVICHYCLQRSPNTSTSSCLYRFPITIGERAVGVLCTLIYLSYYKLLRTVIDTFTYSTVHRLYKTF
eukprot:Em0038g30a